MAHFVYPTANPMAQVAPPAQGYASAQGAYVAAPQAAYAATAAPQRSQTYESYPAAAASAAVHPSTQYAYSRAQVAVTSAFSLQPTVTYDQSKAYYQPAAATTYTAAADPQFQAVGLSLTTAKPAFSTGATFANAQRQATVAPKAQAIPVSSTGTSYVYSSTTPTVTTYSTTGYTTTTTPQTSISNDFSSIGYDAALYSAASNYYSQQQQGKTGTPSWMVKKATTGNQFKPKPKGPPKAPQLHYCDVCKISCAGPQTYREHLEGQKHKKKEAALKASQPSGRQSHNQMRCELCDVTCTGHDAYAAHIRGAKHQKVVKLHTKLGKPIPSTDPVVATTNKTAAKPASSKSVVVPSSTAAKKVVATPKINFVGGTQLKTLAGKAEEVKAAAAVVAATVPSSGDTTTSMSDDDGDDNSASDKDVTPVGHEYIEEIKNDAGKTFSFNCKLCDCKFNDPNAKEMHLKGRRHRLQYKKKVDPNLQVEVKPSIRVRKIQEDKMRRQLQKEEFWRRKEQQERLREEMRMEDEIYWGHRRLEMMGGPIPPEFMDWQRFGPMGPMMRVPFPMHPMLRRPDSSDDRHVMTKHHSIYPTEDELQAVQNIVSACEKALKLVSDVLAENDNKDKKQEKTEVKKVSPKVEVSESDKEGSVVTHIMEALKIEKKDESGSSRVLKGVMRVGVLAKGLLLHGDLNVNLVVLCSEKPTRTMLEQVADALPKQLATVTSEQLDVRRCVEEAAIIVSSEADPPTSCTITLTSPIMREANLPDGETVNVKDPPDVLDRQKCLDALAALRHAKWFQARANGLPSCVIIIRILRDLCQRVPAWVPLNEWAMELLVEKCVSTGGANMAPGDSLRRVFECIASGIFLPGGPGLYDPCEKEAYDVTATLTNQQREDITALAQNALRLIAFRQIHKVLGMDPLPAPRFPTKRFSNRKRRHTSSTGEEAAEKKDRKEKEAETAAQ
ncbi:unnamed protein product [Lymnaea stagnalis]|uniref:DZF domain-containing protein n=1 Tax=Lymnaea stagnalis TaxID=6523 RepID=A0AAV2IPU2_LYMST